MRIWTIRREGSFPTQFFGKTYEQQFFYGRFRGGRLTLGVSDESKEAAIEASIDKPTLDVAAEGGGIMEIEDFLRILRERSIFC